MSPDQLGFALGSGWLGLKLSGLIIESAGRSLYDFRQINTRKTSVDKNSRRPKYIKVAVLISGKGNSADLKGCLESLASQDYPKLDVIITDLKLNISEQKKLIKKIKIAHPKLKLRLVGSKHDNGTRKMYRPPKDCVLISLDAQNQLSSNSLNKINDYIYGGKVGIIVPAEHVMPDQSLVSLVQEYDALRVSGARILGLYLNRQSQNEIILTAKQPVNTRSYADDIAIFTRSKTTYRSILTENVRMCVNQLETMSTLTNTKKLINLIIGLSAMLEPFAIAYFAYLAVAFDRPEPLVIGWGLGVSSLILYAYTSKHLSFVQKLRLILLAPVGYIELLLLSLTRMTALFGYLAKWLKNDWQSWKPA